MAIELPDIADILPDDVVMLADAALKDDRGHIHRFR
jgi:hypothetical protein